MLEAIITQTRIPVIHLCTSLYRASVIRQALNDDSFMFRNKEFGCEDIQVAFVMAQQGNIAYLPDVTLNYSQGQETISFSPNYHKQFTFARRVGDLSYYIATKHGIASEHTERYFNARAFELGMYAFRAYDLQLFQEARKYTSKWVRKPSASLQWLFFVMRHPGLWRLGLQARRVFVNAKQLLRRK
jgi:glucosyltransferase